MKNYLFYIFFFLLWLPIHSSAQNVEGDLDCTAAGCHNSLIGKKHVHLPVSEDCSTCHEANENKHPTSEGNEFSLTADIPELCYMCHEEPSGEGTIHAPVEAGECTTCHSPHSSDNPFLLPGKTIGEICSTCHNLKIEKPKSVHLPVQEQNCQYCHNPHQSVHSSLLKKDIPQLCFLCHDKQKSEMTMNNIHPPFEECSNCHEAHQSTQRKLLRANVPDLCFTCHSDLQENMPDSSLVHAPFISGKSCVSCHSPHASTAETLTLSEQPQICLQCHGRQISLKDRKIANIKEKLGKRNTVHEAINSGGCTSCHNPHYSENRSLLIDSFPAGKYSSDYKSAYNLCFSCHDSEMLARADVDGETNFRLGKLNLHFLHVSRQKSRSCSNCHDPHGTKNKHLIAEKVQFGQWQMSLNYKVFKGGGSCRPGCHGEKKYGVGKLVTSAEIESAGKMVLELNKKSVPKTPSAKSLSEGTKSSVTREEKGTEAVRLPESLTFSEYQAKYEEALGEYEKKNYRFAIQFFKELLRVNSSNSLADNCRYWIGESYYGLKDYEHAIQEFDKVFTFSNSNKNDAAFFKIGLCYQKMNLPGFAREAYKKLIEKYPESELLETAKRYLARLK